MKNILLFEDFDSKAEVNFEGITLEDLKSMKPDELGWRVWKYGAVQPRAWGQWEAKQAQDFRKAYSKLVEADKDHGLVDEDVIPFGKFLLDPKQVKILEDLTRLFNKNYPGLDYK